MQRASGSPTAEEDLAADAVPFVFALRESGTDAGDAPRHKRTTRHTQPLAQPDWWEAESRRRLAAFSRKRDSMRYVLHALDVRFPEQDYRTQEVPLGLYIDLPGLETVAEIAPLLRRLIQRQFKWWRETYGTDAIDPEDGVTVLDLHRNEWDVIEYPAETWEQDRRTERVPFPPVGMITASRDMEPDLDMLHRQSLRLADNLGLTQPECIAWGLSDVPFTIPWLAAATGHEWTWEGEWTTVTLRINAESTTAHDVAKAYTSARGPIGPHVPRRRAPRPGPQCVVAFVDKRKRERPGETWPELFAAFRSEHPEYHYGSYRTFADAYRNKAKGAKP